VPAIVWVVLIASLTAPLWEGTVLSGLGIHTPSARSAARNTTALEQQDARLTTLEQRLTSTTTQLDAMRANLTLAIQRATDATSQARAVALLRLADALRGAAPFATELAVVRATGSDTGNLQPALTQLAPYATTGAPTIDQLQRELRVLYDSVARAVRQANPASWTDLMNWAGRHATASPNRPQPARGTARTDPPRRRRCHRRNRTSQPGRRRLPNRLRRLDVGSQCPPGSRYRPARNRHPGRAPRRHTMTRPEVI
jgi:uncharacterized coiled-coil protein SlyX